MNGLVEKPGVWARKYTFKTISRFARKNRLLVADSGAETFVVNSSDSIISKRLYSKGEFDFDKLLLSLELIGSSRKVEHLFDIGAHIGPISIPAVKRGVVKSALAIEPEPNNFSLLMANIWLNGLSEKIEALNYALGPNDDEFLEFSLSETNYGDHRVVVDGSQPGNKKEKQRTVIRVPSKRLDSLVGERDLSKSLLWMDTQGFEGHILKGAENVLKARVPCVLEFWPGGMDLCNSFEPLVDLLTRYYTCFYDLRKPSLGKKELTRETLTEYYELVKKRNDERDILVL